MINLRSTVFSLHRQELMAATILLLVYKQWGYCSSRTATFPIPFPTAALFIVAVPKTTSTSATATGAEYLGTTSVNLYLHGTSGWYFVGGH